MGHPPDLALRTREPETSAPTLKVRCREIGTADLERIVDMLTEGYQISNRDFWGRRIKRLSEHSPPPGYPKYGFLLECDGTPVGVIFTLFSYVIVNGIRKIRCYPVTWYVARSYRTYAASLASRALKYKDVTYIIGTPIDHVLPILAAQGYVRFCEGRFIAVPALSRQSEPVHVELAAPNLQADSDITPFEVELLSRHTGYGCISLICTNATGKFPFVFHPLRKRGLVPFARLVYCRDFDDFIRFAGAIGRFLVRRGYPFVVLDANGPVRGLVGVYSNNFPKHFKGPDRPRLGDFAYSSRVIFDY